MADQPDPGPESLATGAADVQRGVGFRFSGGGLAVFAGGALRLRVGSFLLLRYFCTFVHLFSPCTAVLPMCRR